LFLDKVESSLRERGMRAPIMVFKGDGTLMNIHTARKRPVETILSGPAASSMGGRILAGVDSCIIVDIGGTSTDIAFLEDGFPKVTREGATVGKWRTRVRAVDMWTAALGGDSEVLPGEGKVSLGSRRVIPLSMAATRWPELLDRMRGSGDISYYVAFSSEEKDLVEGEGSVFRFLLENGPATSREVQRGTGVVLVDRQLRSLAGGNMVAGIGLTPTDCLHVNGTYTQGSVEAARLGVETASRSTGLSAGEMVDEVLNRVAAGISEEIIKKVMLDEGSSPSASGGCGYLMDTATGKRRPGMLRFQVRLDRPVVGIGAPAHVYLPMVQDRLGTEVIVPEEHDVGNAVGAVCSPVVETVELVVFPKDERYTVFSPFEIPHTFSHVDQAVGAARNMASKHVEKRAREAGAKDIKVTLNVDEKRSLGGENVEGEIINRIEVRAKAVGQPSID
ncbi:MAG: hydantoinase/oxoprolinase family protein, partial [Methanomassiliicoccales archaeon]